MSTPITERGFFWWHDDPSEVSNSKQTSVPGILTISELGEIRLKVYGRLTTSRNNEWVQPSRFPVYSKIQGQLTEQLSHVLLEGIERLDYSSADESPQEQEFSVDWCLRRSFDFPETFTPADFSSVEICADELAQWFGKRSLQPKRNYNNESVEIQDIVTYDRWKVEYPVSAASVLTIESRTYSPITIFPDHKWDRIEFSQHFYLSIKTEQTADRSLFLTFHNVLEEFLSLLLGRYHHLGWPELVSSTGDLHTLYFKRSHPPTDNFDAWLALCSFPKLEQDFGSLFHKWLEVKNTLVPAIQIYIATLRHPFAYAEDRFTVLAIGIECLHRRWLAEPENSDSIRMVKAKVQRILDGFSGSPEDKLWLTEKLAYAHEPSLRKRIKECLKQLPLPIAKKSLVEFAGACTNRRNDLTHEGMERHTSETAGSLSTGDLGSALAHFFHFLILHLIGMKSDILFEAATNSFYSRQIIEPALSAVRIRIDTENQGPES